MNIAETTPQSSRMSESPVPLRKSLPTLSSLRHQVQRFPFITSSNRHFAQRVMGFEDIIDTTIVLSRMYGIRRGSRPLSYGEKEIAVRYTSYQTAQELAKRIMNSTSPKDTTYAIALWEQLTTMANLTSEIFTDVNPIAIQMRDLITGYFQNPAKLGFTSNEEQKDVTRRFKIIGKVKPREIFQLRL